MRILMSRRGWWMLVDDEQPVGGWTKGKTTTTVRAILCAFIIYLFRTRG